MPIYTVEIPGSGTYDIESESDITDAQAYQYAMLQAKQTAAHEAKTGIGAATKSAFEKALGSADVGIAGALSGLGFPEQAAEFEQAGAKRTAKAQEIFEPTTDEEVAAAEARGVLPGLLAKGKQNIAEPLGGVAGRYGPTMVATMLGGMPGRILAGGAEYLTTAGEIQERGGTPAAAYTMSAPLAAVNAVGLPFGPLSRKATKLTAKVLGRAVPEVAEQSVIGAAKVAQDAATKEGMLALDAIEGKAGAEAMAAPYRAATAAAKAKAEEFPTSRSLSTLAGDIATSTVGNVAVGVPTALAQESMIRAASGEQQQTPEEMMASAKQMALLSPVFGAMHGTLRNATPEVRQKAMETAEAVRTRPEALAAEEAVKSFETPPRAETEVEEAIAEPTIVSRPESLAKSLGLSSNSNLSKALNQLDTTDPAHVVEASRMLRTVEEATPNFKRTKEAVDELHAKADEFAAKQQEAVHPYDAAAKETGTSHIPYNELTSFAQKQADALAAAESETVGPAGTFPTDKIPFIQDINDRAVKAAYDNSKGAEHPAYEELSPQAKATASRLAGADIHGGKDVIPSDVMQFIADVHKSETKAPTETTPKVETPKVNLKPIPTAQGGAPIVDYGERKFVVVDVNGTNVPFYLSTGLAGKKDVAAGKWYPVFGIDKQGWINKGTQEEINNHYGSPELAAVAKQLDEQIGDIRTPDGEINPHPEIERYSFRQNEHDKAALDFINSSFNHEPSRANLYKNIEDVKQKVAKSGETTPKVDEALKAKEEALAKHAEEPTPENAAEAINSTIMHDTAEREAARPVVEDTAPPLKAEEPKVDETPTDAEATLLNNRYSTTREPENLSLMDKVKDFTKNVVQRHADKWAPVMGKVGKKYGMYTDEGVLNAGYLGHQLDQAWNMMGQAALRGGLKVREDGQIELRHEPIKLHTGESVEASIVNMHKLINSLGPNGKDITNEILRVKDEARQLKLDPSKVSRQVSENPQAFQEKVKAADQFIKENPVMQDIINMYRKVHEMQIDFHEQTGLLDKDLANFFRSQEDYSPRFEMRDEVLDRLGADTVKRTPIGGMFTKTFRERTGADHEVNPLENIVNQFTGDYMKSWYNHVKSHTADQLTKAGAAKYIGRTKIPGKQGNVAVLRNGKREFYAFDNPADLPAMQIAANSLGPLAFATKASHALRFGALANPGFWWKELARNPIAATLTSDLGWISPLRPMYEVTKILRGENEVFRKLQNSGIVGTVDPTMDPREMNSFIRGLGVRMKDETAVKRSVGHMLRNLENFHTAFDAATKCAVYRMAYDKGIREGMTPRKADGYALTKARESFNHNVSGSAEMQRNARMLIPFLGSQINALELLRKNIMMPHIKESERAAYRKQFINKAATFATLSGAYAFMMSGNKDYDDAKDHIKYNNILIPTGIEGHPIGIALPPDLSFLYWIPTMMVSYTLGTKDGSDLWDATKSQLQSMVPGGMGYTGAPIPQVFKPLIEGVLGKSSYTGQDIISMGDKSKLPEERGEFTSSLTAKTIGKAAGISPPIIDHYATGYLAEVGKMAMWAADAFLETLGQDDGITKPEKHWTQTPGLGLQSVFGQHLGTQDLDDFYRHKEEADQLRKSFNDMVKAGPSKQGAIKEFTADKDRMGRKNAATQMDAFAKQMTVLENQSRMIMRSKLPEEEITKRVEANKKKRNEIAKRANDYWKKIGARY